MLDITLIRQNSEEVKRGIAKKGFDPNLVDEFLVCDEKWRGVATRLDKLRAEQNGLSEKLGKGNPAPSFKEELLEGAKKVKVLIQSLEEEKKAFDEEREKFLSLLPNLPFSDVPVGKSDKENKVLREVGKKPKFDFKPKDHLEIAEALHIVDFERGAKVAGSGFYYLKNDGVLLEMALARFSLDFLRKNGFDLWFTPDLAKDTFYLGTGYLPKGEEAQTYVIEDSNLGLIATAEVTLAGLHANETLKEGELPRFYAGYSHCFRQEAGAYGKYSKGLYRVHQFTKVEMFAFTKPEDSEAAHQKLLKLEEELWQSLGIPYRVLEMCTGDLGSQAARKYDLEAWMPGRAHSAGRSDSEESSDSKSSGQGDGSGASPPGGWGEITSTSNTTDYQARRLKIKYKKSDGSSEFVHTLNGTAIPTSRAIVAILENFQKKDGSVEIPKALRKYVGKKMITSK